MAKNWRVLYEKLPAERREQIEAEIGKYLADVAKDLEIPEQVTDLDTLKQMFRRAGVVFDEEGAADHGGLVDVDRVICVEPGANPQNGGYTGFFTEFFFDKDGKLLGMGAWE